MQAKQAVAMKQQEHDDNEEIVIQRPVIENELRFTYDQIRYVCCDSDASYSFDDCIVQLDWIPKLVISPIILILIQIQIQILILILILILIQILILILM